MEEIQSEKAKIQEVEEDVGTVKSRIAMTEVQMKKLREVIEELQRHWARMEERIGHAHKQHLLKMEAARQSLELAQKELLLVFQF